MKPTHHKANGCSKCSRIISSEDYNELNLMNFLYYTAVVITILIIGFINISIGNDLYGFIAFLVVLLVCGAKLGIRAVTKLVKERAFSIELLVIIAAIGAFVIGKHIEGSIVVFLFNIATFLEDYASDSARKSIEMLLREYPTKARVVKGNKEYEVNVENVNPGDIIVIRPGEKIPLDGVIVEGSADVNEAPLTGESIPIIKKKGDRVYAGTICMNGVLLVRVEKKAQETLLAKVINLVKRARKEKSDIERFVEKFSKYYTPSILLSALVVIILFPLIYGGTIESWIYRSLTLLVISCPCALVISIPVAMVSGLVGGARNGILIKGGKYLEHLSKTNVIAFDKTGTLTKGKLVLTKIIPFKIGKLRVLQIAASLSQYSKHPISNAVIQKAKELRIEPLKVLDFKSIPGEGVIAKIEGKQYFMGNEKLLKKFRIPIPTKEIEKLRMEGTAIALIANENSLLGILGFEDELRSEAITIIKELKKRGFRIIMLTGDHENVAKRIANKLGIDEYFAELLPDSKVKVIEELMGKHERHVAMVGDGINDAPALVRACVGIAMGSGTKIAIESGDIVLMKPNLKKIIHLINLSNKTIGIVKQNVTISILIKMILAVMAIVGLVELWMAVLIGDMGLSLAVIINALRLSTV